MTCIVGLVQNGVVYIGGDSASSDKTTIRLQDSPKVFEREGYIFGAAGSIRMSNILEMRVPAPKSRDSKVSLRRHLITTWVDDDLRRVFDKLGFLQIEKNVERGSNFLVGHKGELCVIWGSFLVATPKEDYTAIGSGGSIALGALFALSKEEGLSGKRRVLRVLEAAEHYDPFVRQPFTILQS